MTVLNEAPVRFWRPAGMKPLPTPLRGGSLDELRPFVNTKDEAGFVLIVGYLVAAFRPAGPYFVIIVTGEQGTAKSTLCRIIRLSIDPNVSPLRSAPREEPGPF